MGHPVAAGRDGSLPLQCGHSSSEWQQDIAPEWQQDIAPEGAEVWQQQGRE